MTWDELTDLLTRLGEGYDLKVHVVRREGLDTVALHIVPVAWFVAMRFTGALNMGVYEGEENRLVGTEQIPLAELTPEFVRERVDAAMDKAVAARGVQLVLDPEAVRDFFEVMQKQRSRDLDPGRLQDVDQNAP